MPTKRLPVRQAREILRLTFEGGLPSHELARRVAVVLFSISLFANPLSAVIFLLSLVGSRRFAIVALVLLIVWLVPVALDHARGLWLGCHPYTSLRWLRGVRAAVGYAVFNEARVHLTILHGSDLGYRIKRAHLTNTV